ncbi:MAG: helix-turn-helix domain-containing protein, partial [Clostridiales bacterium]
EENKVVMEENKVVMEENKISDECKNCTETDEKKRDICSICVTQKVFRGKWKLVILWQLKDGKKRFSQLQKSIHITQSSLTKQLRELEGDGIISRKVYNIIPPKVEYSLTPVGSEFIKVMEQINNWGKYYIKNMDLK